MSDDRKKTKRPGVVAQRRIADHQLAAFGDEARLLFAVAVSESLAGRCEFGAEPGSP